MADNRYSGDVEIVINGDKYTLRADWAAIAKAQEALEDPNVLQRLFNLNTVQLAHVTAALLSHHHPAITHEKVMELSPTLVDLMAALNKAILYAYTGADGVKEVEEGASAKKKK